VQGGSLKDNNNGIYLLQNGKPGKLIGYSATPESFYNSEAGAWMGTINPNDQSGRNFLNQDILAEDPNILSYMVNATGGEKYDFKRTNGSDKVLYENTEDFYRGMPILSEHNGKPVFGSARDVGNIAAGLVAGRDGMGWSTARLGFDALQSWQQKSFTTETSGTQFGQRLGHRIGSQIYQKTELSRLPGNGHLRDIQISTAPIRRKEF
jgi:hypothetical protein